MMKNKIIIICAISLFFLAASPAMANVIINVPGTASPYFAGQSAASITAAIPLIGYDTTDFHGDDASNIPPYVDITGFGGTILSITAVGEWGHTPVPNSGPDGYDAYDATHQEYFDLGISPVIDTRLNVLVGVFLTDAAPVALSAPTSLTFGDDMTSPLLQQAFVIGSSLENITIPGGATRLFFGLNNGYEWNNNSGTLTVTITPIPAPGAILLGSIGVGLVGWLRRRKAL